MKRTPLKRNTPLAAKTGLKQTGFKAKPGVYNTLTAKPREAATKRHTPSKRTKALDITQKVKSIVWERDGGCCIICGRCDTAMPNAHYIARSHGGLGIEENIGTLCRSCHDAYDNGGKRAEIGEQFRSYLDLKYPGFSDEGRVYDKWA